MRLLWSIMTAFHCTNAALAVELTKQMQVQNLIHDLSTKTAPNQHPQIRRETFFQKTFYVIPRIYHKVTAILRTSRLVGIDIPDGTEPSPLLALVGSRSIHRDPLLLFPCLAAT